VTLSSPKVKDDDLESLRAAFFKPAINALKAFAVSYLLDTLTVPWTFPQALVESL